MAEATQEKSSTTATSAPKAPKTVTVRFLPPVGADGKPMFSYGWTPGRSWTASETVVEVVEPRACTACRDGKSEHGEKCIVCRGTKIDDGDPVVEGRPDPLRIGARTLRQLQSNKDRFVVSEGGALKVGESVGDDKARIRALEEQLAQVMAQLKHQGSSSGASRGRQ